MYEKVESRGVLVLTRTYVFFSPAGGGRNGLKVESPSKPNTRLYERQTRADTVHGETSRTSLAKDSGQLEKGKGINVPAP